MSQNTPEDTGPRLWRAHASVTYPSLEPGVPLTDPVERTAAEAPLRSAAEAWLRAQFDGHATLDEYRVIEALVDAGGAVVQWAATFVGVGEHPTQAPDWWSSWTPETDAVEDGPEGDPFVIELDDPVPVGNLARDRDQMPDDFLDVAGADEQAAALAGDDEAPGTTAP